MVFPDADVGRAVRTVSAAIFANTGECCEAGSRLFVHEDVADDLLDGLIDAAESMVIGDPLQEETDLGPKVSEEEVDRTLSYLESAQEDDATFLTGGSRTEDDGLPDGCFVQPTVLADLDHDHEAVQEEIFGPVLEVFQWSDYDRMIELANDVDYGLTAGILTDDIKHANRTARDLEAGYVWINTYHELVPGLPFCGCKESGIGRELAYELSNTTHGPRPSTTHSGDVVTGRGRPSDDSSVIVGTIGPPDGPTGPMNWRGSPEEPRPDTSR